MQTLLTPVRRIALAVIVAASLVGATAQPTEAQGIPDDILCFLFLGSGCLAIDQVCKEVIGEDFVCDIIWDVCIDTAVDICFQ